MVVTLGQQYNIGEKPTVILYTYINPFGTIDLTTSIFFLLNSPVLVALFYMDQPPWSVILHYTVYIPQVVYAYFVSNRGC